MVFDGHLGHRSRHKLSSGELKMTMTNSFRIAVALVGVLLCPAPKTWAEPIRERPQVELKIFSGEPRLLIAHGYSTSKHWWAFLQRKIDRYMDSEKRVVEVQLCNKGGTPIAGWMNVNTGERSVAWKYMLTPMIQAEKGKRPVVLLCQQSLQGVYRKKSPANSTRTGRAAGIRNADDRERIKRGADVIQQYARNILDDGAAAVVVGMHIYKRSMEPAIGNERLALAELMTRKLARIYSGPDVWTPTSRQFPLAFDTDKAHPNFIGAEIMAHQWFKTLLEREGLEVPEWSRQEVEHAINNQPLGLTRDDDVFQQKLKKWKIVSRRPSVPPLRRNGRSAEDREKTPKQSPDRDEPGKAGKRDEAMPV
jgi:hypothetical protein